MSIIAIKVSINEHYIIILLLQDCLEVYTFA